MDNDLTLQDIIYYLKNKKMIIIGSMLIFGLLSIGYLLLDTYVTGDNQQNVKSSEEEISEDININELLKIDKEERTSLEQKEITDYLSNDMYFFRVYIENNDFSVFNRTSLFKEVLLSDEVLALIKEEVTIENESFLDDYINVDLNTDNAIFTVYVSTGNTALNDELSSAYFDILKQDNIEILNDRSLYFFDSPRLFSFEDESLVNDSEDIIEDRSVSDYAIYALLGAIFGIVFGIVFSVIHSVFSNKVDAIYNYKMKKQDKLINLTNNTEDSQTLNHAIHYPSRLKRIILVEKNNEDIINKSQKNIDSNNEIVNEFSSVQIDREIDEAVIIVKRGFTKKKWYEKQRNQIKGNLIPIKIIEV